MVVTRSILKQKKRCETLFIVGEIAGAIDGGSFLSNKIVILLTIWRQHSAAMQVLMVQLHWNATELNKQKFEN